MGGSSASKEKSSSSPKEDIQTPATNPVAIYYPSLHGTNLVDPSKPFANTKQPLSVDLFIWAALNNPLYGQRTFRTGSEDFKLMSTKDPQVILKTISPLHLENARNWLSKNPFFHLNQTFDENTTVFFTEMIKYIGENPVWGPFEDDGRFAIQQNRNEQEYGFRMKWDAAELKICIGNAMTFGVNLSIEDTRIRLDLLQNGDMKQLLRLKVMEDGSFQNEDQ